MKKTYIQPSMVAIKIGVHNVIASSPTPQFNPNGQSSTMDARGGIFDEDEE